MLFESTDDIDCSIQGRITCTKINRKYVFLVAIEKLINSVHDFENLFYDFSSFRNIRIRSGSFLPASVRNGCSDRSLPDGDVRTAFSALALCELMPPLNKKELVRCRYAECSSRIGFLNHHTAHIWYQTEKDCKFFHTRLRDSNLSDELQKRP